MDAFTKIVRPATYKPEWSETAFSTFVKIEWDGSRLSITGVEGPTMSGNARGGSGQIHENLTAAISSLAPGWDRKMIERLRDLWQRWHLNDMRAGSPAQETYLRLNPVSFTYPDTHYDAASRALDAAGLNPINERYGSKWWREDVPEDVLVWLAALPDADRKPAWI